MEVLPDMMTECGTFTDHGFGFHRREDDGIRYMIAWPIDPLHGHWAVLSDTYSLENGDREDFCDDAYLSRVLKQHGFRSIHDLREACGNDWQEALTCHIAEEQHGSRYAVSNTCASDRAVISVFANAGADPDRVAGLIERAHHEMLAALKVTDGLSPADIEFMARELEDVLVDDDGCLVEDWYGYPAGENREQIWLDIDEAHPDGYVSLMRRLAAGQGIEALAENARRGSASVNTVPPADTPGREER